MDFTTGQIIFGVIFFIAFLGIIIYTYRKDLKLHRANYKGVKYIVIGFLLFILFLFVLKEFLNP